MKALLIIDMQQGGFKPGNPRFDTSGVISRINLLSQAVREAGHKVIFIQHNGSKENDFIPGTADWELLSSLKRDDGSDLIISKTANDPFYASALQTTLDELKVKELIITGWATDFCVDAAIRGALCRDFNILVVKDAHTCGNRPHLPAERVIQHHNWLWENMIATNGSIRVLSTKQALAAVRGGIQEPEESYRQ